MYSKSRRRIYASIRLRRSFPQGEPKPSREQQVVAFNSEWRIAQIVVVERDACHASQLFILVAALVLKVKAMPRVSSESGIKVKDLAKSGSASDFCIQLFA